MPDRTARRIIDHELEGRSFREWPPEAGVERKYRFTQALCGAALRERLKALNDELRRWRDET